MTEAEWTETDHLTWLLNTLRNVRSPTSRKTRLFGVACCRRVLAYIEVPVLADAVNACERQADGCVPDLPLGEWAEIIRSHVMPIILELDDDQLRLGHLGNARNAIEELTNSGCSPWAVAEHCREALCGYEDIAGLGETLFQVDLLRDIFGNPFRPVAFAPEWRSSATVALADAMYQSRDFGPMPVLADALEEAGCANADILSHCRGDGPHVRGCWVVDLVLGRA